MAPKKGTKRNTAEAACGVAQGKKPKANPMYAAVAEAIDRSDLSENCRAMLKAAIPGCLGVPTEDRHEIQASTVQMIGSVVEAVEAKIQEDLNAKRAKVEGFEASKGELSAKVAEAEVCLDQAKQVVDAKKLALAEVTKGMTDAKAKLSEKREAQRVGDKSLIEARDAKAALEKAVDVEFRAIKDGTPGAHYTATLPVLQTLALDDALMIALPSTIMKVPSDRGSFDHMVIEQLEKSLADKGAELAQILEEGSPAADERAADVDAARNHFESLKESQQKAAEAMAIAQVAQREKVATVAEAKADLAQFEPNLQKAVQACEEKAAELQNFQAYDVECFKMLRDKTMPVAKVEIEVAAEVTETPSKSKEQKVPPSPAVAAEAGTPMSVGGA